MSKISSWVIGMTMIVAGSISVSGQTQSESQQPQQPQQQTTQPERSQRQKGFGRGKGHPPIDTNQDGQISREEWKRPAEVFDRLDADHNGTLTREELSAGRKHRGPRGGKGFRRADQNNDGQVTREEWKGSAEIFDRIDANKDGILERDEVRSARRKRQ